MPLLGSRHSFGLLFLAYLAIIPPSFTVIFRYFSISLPLAKIYCCFLLLVGSVLFACNPTSQESLSVDNSSSESSLNYTKLDPPDFAHKLNELDNELLIDVRTPDEYNTGHLEGATILDFRDSNFRKQVDHLDRSRPVMIYCAAGGRSSAAVTVLQELGFAEIYELQGGLTSWVGEGRATTE